MTEKTEVNIPLLRKAVEWAEAEAAKPESECMWNQFDWLDVTDCGTTFCIAGFVAAQQMPVEDVARSAQAWPSDSDSVPTVASTALGIAPWTPAYDYDAERPRHLFDASNTIEDVRRIAESLAGERL